MKKRTFFITILLVAIFAYAFTACVTEGSESQQAAAKEEVKKIYIPSLSTVSFVQGTGVELLVEGDTIQVVYADSHFVMATAPDDGTILAVVK